MKSFDLLDTLEDLLILVQKEKLHPGEETHVKHLIYRVESQLEQIKLKHRLGTYNAAIFSERIAKSFYWVERDIFDNEVSELEMAISEIDYQYWALVFLLDNLKEITESHPSLIELIERFIDHHKDKSLTCADIAFTASGATRCRTNLRFTFSSLKEMGLIKLHEKDENQQTNILTFFGYMLAASIINDPDPKRPDPVSAGIPQLHVTRVMKIDQWLLHRIETLGKQEYFEGIVNKLFAGSSVHSTLTGMEQVFAEYAKFCAGLAARRSESSSYTKEIAELRDFLSGIEERFNLSRIANTLGPLDLKINRVSV